MRVRLAVTLFITLPSAGAAAQAPVPADSARLSIMVYSSKAVANQGASTQQRQGDIAPLAGATVTLSGNEKLVSNDTGYVIGHMVKAGRSDFVVTAQGHQRYRCRVTLDGGKENAVRVELLSEKQSSAWGQYGCKKIY